MTRWSTKDLIGRLLEAEQEKWEVISMPAQADDGTMLCPDILDEAEFEDRKRKTDPVIIAGNYQQSPYDAVDKLYGPFREYSLDQIPEHWERIEGYADTADQGGDSFAGGIYGIHEGVAYILDILFSTEGMEKTEIQFARMINATGASLVYIESNNGGQGFARNVERHVRAAGNLRTGIRHFHQSANKEARILTNAFSVVNAVRFPPGWRERWPLFAKELESMGRAEKWKHDDAADFLTGIIEKSLAKRVVVL